MSTFQIFMWVLLAIFFLCFGACQNKSIEGHGNFYLLDDKELVPEGIDYSAVQNAFYLTSVAKSKIIKVNAATGEQSDFIRENEFEYMPGVGLLIDDHRNELHALGGYYMTDDSRTALYTFDLSTGDLKRKLNIEEDGDHFLNDMILDQQGAMYLTDTKFGAVYYLSTGGDSLELFYRSEEIEFPNGIAINDQNTKLYVASISKGIQTIELASKEIINNLDTSGISVGIDGLEYYKGSLYAIQNGVPIELHNFRKLILDQKEENIIRIEVIAGNTPELNVPLTFCIKSDGTAVVIGNSNLQFLDQVNFTFSNPDSLKQTKLLIYDLLR